MQVINSLILKFLTAYVEREKNTLCISSKGFVRCELYLATFANWNEDRSGHSARNWQ